MAGSDVVRGSYALLGRGKVYVDVLGAADARTGEQFLGSTDGFTITPTQETREVYDFSQASAPLLASAVIRNKMAMGIKFREISPETLKLFASGDTSTVGQTSGSLSNYAISDVLQGRFYETGKRGLSAVTVTGTGGTPTYVVTTDYKVDTVRGRIYIVPGGGIADLTDIEVDATVAAVDLPRVRAGNTSQIKAFVRFVGDPQEGATWEIKAWLVNLRADGELAMIGDDFAQGGLVGDVLADLTNHPNEPFFEAIQIAT